MAAELGTDKERAKSWLYQEGPALNEKGWGAAGPHIPAAAPPFQPVLTCSHNLPDCPGPSSQRQFPESFADRTPNDKDHSLKAP